MMRTIKLLLEYDGSAFSGWQAQTGQRTIQGELERVLAMITRGPISLVVAGRTDAGVHALGQVASFTTEFAGPLATLQRSVNALLGQEIAVRGIEEAPADFHARFSARSRIYCFAILNRPSPSPFLARYAWHVQRPLDRDAIRGSLQLLEGEHDFSSFCASHEPNRSTIRQIFRAWVEEEGAVLLLYFHANAFLHHMIRIIVGTVRTIGHGHAQPETMAIILAARDRSRAGATAPPQGLCLLAVQYDDSPVVLPHFAPWFSSGSLSSGLSNPD